MVLEKVKGMGRRENEKNNDFKIYFVVCIMYLIGIVIGAIYFRIIINDTKLKENIFKQYTLIEETQKLPKIDILTESTLKNIKTILVFWVIGVSAIGSPFLVLLCSYKGFMVAFTISTILMNMGFLDGNIYVFKEMFLYTLFSVFGIIILTVSSLKVSVNIFKNKKDTRLEIIRHSIITLISTVFFICSILIETF